MPARDWLPIPCASSSRRDDEAARCEGAQPRSSETGKFAALLEKTRTAELFDFSDSPRLSITADGRIVEMNLAAANLMQVADLPVQPWRFHDFVSAESKLDFEALIERAFASNAEQCCTLILHMQFSACQTVVAIRAMVDPIEGFCRIVLVDVDAAPLK